MCSGTAPLDRVSACEALLLPPAPVALCLLRVRAVSGARPQRHRSTAPPRVWYAGTIRPAMESRDGPARWLSPLRSAGGGGGVGRSGEGGSRTDTRASLLGASPSPKPLASYLRPCHTGALRSSFFGESSLRGAATVRTRTASLASRRSHAPRSCMALLGPPVPWRREQRSNSLLRCDPLVNFGDPDRDCCRSGATAL
ncbi:hypothetical protein NDU88_002184 [Pleurodeles waltl]|uniref:Uncharacterized protein n=1 Tax=Pleurodeles waltl TaxID=8319 RepID=A0AAV7MLZ4_PLEWA|nr:hypothetical protein NDU88_002184 [Pleurodeles waltl]